MYRSCRHPHERLIVFFLLLQHTSMFANLKLKKEIGEKKLSNVHTHNMVWFPLLKFSPVTSDVWTLI